MPRIGSIPGLSLLLILLLAMGSAQGQSVSQPDDILLQDQQQQDAAQGSADGRAEAGDQQPQADWDNARYGPPPQGQQRARRQAGAREEGQVPAGLPPFGAKLFQGGFRTSMADGLNEQYEVKPGDQVTVRAWGAVEIDTVLPVDAQGNIFLPQLGPLQVQGLTGDQVDAQVRQAVQSVYPEDVNVYTNLQGVQPVGVFVAGYVDSPGRYAGNPNDSLLYFLNQAGGIEAGLGSYRRIQVKRDGEVIARADLYDFLTEGGLPEIQFRDGDTIVVQPRGASVAVIGDVEQGYRFELLDDRLEGARVLQLAPLGSDASHALVRGTRGEGEPISRYVELDAFRDMTLRSGDEVVFAADRRRDRIVVEVQGSYKGPSQYILPKDARLGELLDSIAVPREITAVEDVSIQRESIAERQAEALKESLRRLETTYLGQPSATAEEAKVRAREAELIKDFVERARDIEPSGRLVVADGGKISNVRLRHGDVVTIPSKSDSVLLSGEVEIPQAVVYEADKTVEDYISGAGGYTSRAARDRTLLVRQNGAVVRAAGARPQPGDQIIVMPKVPTKNLELAKSISQILYQVAVATKVAIDL